MSSTLATSSVNGHLSRDDAMASTVIVEVGRSDTDLPDAHDSPMTHSTPSDSELPARETPDLAERDQASLDSDNSSIANASEDADFDMQESVASQQDDDGERECETSPDSSRASKRKAAVSEDEFIKANPELYGLRRSVCCAVLLL